MKSLEQIRKENSEIVKEIKKEEVKEIVNYVKDFLDTSYAQSLSLDDKADRKLFVSRFKNYLRKNLR